MSKNKTRYRLRLINLKGSIFYLIVLGAALFIVSRYFPSGGFTLSSLFAPNQFVNDENNFCYKLQNTQVLYLTPQNISLFQTLTVLKEFIAKTLIHKNMIKRLTKLVHQIFGFIIFVLRIKNKLLIIMIERESQIC